MPKTKMNKAVERLARLKGTYGRRLNDAFDAKQKAEENCIRKSDPVASFIFLFLTCEKIAKIMMAIKRDQPGPTINFEKLKVRSSDVLSAYRLIGGERVISHEEINRIFSKQTRFTAKSLRDRLFHDFGPTHLKEVQDAAPQLNALMAKFLTLGPLVEAHLSSSGCTQS